MYIYIDILIDFPPIHPFPFHRRGASLQLSQLWALHQRLLAHRRAVVLRQDLGSTSLEWHEMKIWSMNIYI